MPPLQRILYVEDEPDIQAVATIALENVGGYQLTICNDGPEALARLSESRAQLALLDVMMPGMDGPQLLQALRSTPEGARLPVIFMTARLQPEEIQEYLDLGAIGVIPKPFDPMTLADQVRELYERAGGE